MGFPYEMTKELLVEQGLSVDDQGFEELMERAREVSRARPGARVRAAADAGGGHVHVDHEDVLRFAREAGFRTRFVGYESTETETVLRVAEGANGWLLAKLEESPFYPEGGGQVSDSGIVETPSGRARVVDVYRLGDDQALALETARGRDRRRRERARSGGARHAARHDAQSHRHPSPPRGAARAARRRTCGRPVRTSGPDKLRFDFTHGERLSPEELADVEHAVSRHGWPPTTLSGRSRPRAKRPRRSARWRCSVRSTATGCGWSRSRTSRASCAAARTWRALRRSASST